MKKLLLLLSVFIVSCQADKESTSPANSYSKEVHNIDASSFQTWTYFSFKENKVVTVSDFANDLSWDIAFHRGDIRLNGGASGKGKAAYLLTDKENLSEVTAVPTNASFTLDGTRDIIISYTPGGTSTNEQQPASDINWNHFMVGAAGPSYAIEKKVFIFRTADGSYVKVKFDSYLNDKGRGGFISFTYSNL